MSLDALNTVLLGTQALVMVIALILTVREYSKIKRESRIKAYNETVDRMQSIRTLLIQERGLCNVFEGNHEGDVLQGLDHKHFYLVKMLLHINESLFLRFFESGKLRRDPDYYDPWLANLQSDLSAPTVQKVWEAQVVKDTFSDKFKKQVQDLIDECQTRSDANGVH
jgi:hypothetical protein